MIIKTLKIDYLQPFLFMFFPEYSPFSVLNILTYNHSFENMHSLAAFTLKMRNKIEVTMSVGVWVHAKCVCGPLYAVMLLLLPLDCYGTESGPGRMHVCKANHR